MSLRRRPDRVARVMTTIVETVQAVMRMVCIVGIVGFARTALLAQESTVVFLREAERDEFFPGVEPLDIDELPRVIVTRIIDAETGDPIPGATMEAIREMEFAYPGGTGMLRRAEADADGWVRLRIDDIRSMVNWIYFDAPGYACHAQGGRDPDYPIRLRRGVDVPIEIVAPLGGPLADVRLEYIIGCGHTPSMRVARTDAAGRAVIASVAPGIGEVWPVAEGVAGEYFDVDPWNPGEPPLRWVMRPGRTFRGRVVDTAGRAMKNVYVGAEHCHRGPFARTNAAGRFVLYGARPDYGLQVRRSGRDAPLWFSDPPRIDAGHVLAIRVDPEASAPEAVATAKMRVKAVRTRPTGEAEAVAGLDLDITNDETGYSAWSTTRADGVLEADVPPGPCTVAVHDVFGEWHGTMAGIVATKEGTTTRLIVRRNPQMRIVVDGLPEEGNVFLVAAEGEIDITEAVRASRSIFHPTATKLAVRLSFAGREFVHRLENLAKRDDGTLVATWPAPRSVRVRLVGPDGEPTPGWVRIGVDSHLDTPGLARLVDSGEPSTAPRLSVHRRGALWLVAEPERPDYGFVARAIVVPEVVVDGGRTPTELDFGVVRFVPANIARLTVLDPDGTPAVGARVEARSPGTVTWYTLDENGHVVDDRPALAVGQRLKITSRDDVDRVPFIVTLTGSPPWRLQAPNGTIVVLASDDAGRPIAQFSVMIDSGRRDAMTGETRFTGLDLGRRRVVVAARGYRAQMFEVNLVTGKPATVVARLMRAR